MKHIIITGAGGSLGTDTVNYFLKKEYHVHAVVHKAEEKTKLPQSKQLDAEAVDLNNEQQSQAYVKNITSKFQIDAALLLAGGFKGSNLKSTSIDDIHQQIAINFETAYNIAKPLWAYFMEQKKGRVVMIGSQLPLQPEKGINAIAYSLSKSLLFSFSELLNKEAKGLDVISAIVAPSTIDTLLNRKYMPDADFDKWVKTEELAELFEFIIHSKTLRDPIFKAYKGVI
jgi:Dehydrogenases with different specificities (related to short-chain alcohol dehydrogenases)